MRLLGSALAAFAVALVPERVLAQDSSEAVPQEEQYEAAETNQDMAAQEGQEESGQEDPDAQPQQAIVQVQDGSEPLDAQQAERPTTLEDIVVTAEKRYANIQDVPMSMTALTGERLEKQGITTFQQIEGLVPGLQLEIYDPVAPRATLRGITHDPQTPTSPTVDLYVNEMNFIVSTAAFQSLFDVERIEVLKGPQTTLRSGTGPGGAIVIITRRPSLTEWDGSVVGNFSANGLRNVQLAGGGPLIDGVLGARLAVAQDQNRINGTTNLIGDIDEESKTKAWRATFSLHPFEDKSIDLTLIHQELESDANPLFILQSVPGSTQEPHLDGYEDRKARSSPPSSLSYDVPYTMLALDWDDLFAGHSLSVFLAQNSYLQEIVRDIDFANAWTAARSPQHVKGETVKTPLILEFRLTSPQDQPWTYRVGGLAWLSTLEIDIEVSTRFNAAANEDPDTPPLFGHDVIVDIPLGAEGVHSYFAETKYDLGEKWSFEIGARQGGGKLYTRAFVTSKNHPNPAFGAAINNFPVIPEDLATVVSQRLTGHFVTTHHMTEDINVYGRYARSHRPHGPNIEAIAVAPNLDREWKVFDEEYADSLEFGLKSDWLDGQLRFNAALFNQVFDGYIYKGPYVPVDQDRDGRQDGAASLIENTPITVFGGESELAYAVSHNLQLSWIVAFSKGRFDGAVIPCTKFNANGDAAFTDENGNPGQQVATCVSDGPIGAVPKFSTSFTGEYIWDFARFNAFLRGIYKYDAERQQTGNFGGGGTSTLPGYGTLNLFFGVHAPDQSWEASLWVKNALDEHALVAGGIGELAFASDSTVLGNPAVAAIYPSGYSFAVPIPAQELGVTLRYSF